MDEERREKLNKLLPHWASLKSLEEAKKEGRVFKSMDELLGNKGVTKEDVKQTFYRTYVVINGKEENVYACEKCGVVVIGYQNNLDCFGGYSQYMSGYDTMKALRASQRPGLCEFCNGPTSPVILEDTFEDAKN